MLMDNKNRLLIFAQYLDGNMQGWGYDGVWFKDYDAMLADVATDFPTDFPDHYQNVVGLRFDWNNGEKAKDLSPVYGEALIETLTKWLSELGVYENGN